jgi:hypothetical protein
MMTVELVFYIILSMLSSDNIKNEHLADPKVQSHLREVAEAIVAEQGPIDPHRLIALAYKETRFGYNPKSLNNGTACGVYQQVPATAIKKVTCGQLVKDVRLATKMAVLYIQYIDRRWGQDEEEDVDQRMCHYYSGNICGDVASAIYVKKYREARRKSRGEYFSFYCESDDEISDRYIREFSDEILLNALWATERAKNRAKNRD